MKKINKKHIFLIIVLIIIILTIFLKTIIIEKFQNEEKIDIVIPYGPNDDWIIQKCINSCIKYINNLNNIYVISYKNVDLDNCIIIVEDTFPFTKEKIAEYTSKERAGWYLQQLIKLYIPKVINKITENFLVVDADVIFYKNTNFIENNQYLYDISDLMHNPYFVHMNKLHPSLIRSYDKSGVCDHMLFNKNYLNELFTLIESYHNKEFYIVFLENIDNSQSSAASEYEIYFNYMLIYHNNKIKIRRLNKKISYKYNEYEDSDEYNYQIYHNHSLIK